MASLGPRLLPEVARLDDVHHVDLSRQGFLCVFVWRGEGGGGRGRSCDSFVKWLLCLAIFDSFPGLPDYPRNRILIRNIINTIGIYYRSL